MLSSTHLPSTDQPQLTQFNNQCRDVLEYFIFDETTRPHVQAVFGIFYATIFLTGLLGNCLVIASVWRYPALQTVRNFFIVSLSCSDIVVCLTSLPITPVTLIKKNWYFGSFLCYAFPLFQGMSICISTFTLMAVAVDRYILIIFPTKRPIQRAQAVPMIIGIWALAAVVCIPMLAHYKYYYGPDRVEFGPIPFNWTHEQTLSTYELYSNYDRVPVFCGYFCDEDWPSQPVQKIYGTFVVVLQFLIPLTVIAFCYSHIWYRLASNARKKRGNAGMRPKMFSNTTADPTTPVPNVGHVSQVENRQQALLRRKRRTNRMLIAMVFVFACSWFPQVTMNLLRDLNWLPQFVFNHMYFYSLLCHAIAMTSTVWNPLLYSFMNSTFRCAFSELMPCLWDMKRTLSGRRSERPPSHENRLRQPEEDSNLGGNDGHACVDAPIENTPKPIPISPMVNYKRRAVSETSSLLPDNNNIRSNSLTTTKHMRASNGIITMNGLGVLVLTEDAFV